MSIPLEVFFSYAPEDEEYRKRLVKALRTLERDDLITGWHDQKVSPGTERASEIDAHLESAHIILLLISPDFLASDYYWEKEVQTAMKRSEAGQARVIPILVRPSNWTKTLFSKLQALPTDGKPITLWSNKDKAFLNVTQGIRDAASDIKKNGISPKKTTPPISQIKMLPYRRNPFFTGREELLRHLHENLTTTTTTVLTQAQAISGLGGIGKTQIALEYAYLYGNEYQCLLWASAVNQETLLNNLVEIAHMLGLPERNEQDQNVIVEAVKHWLTVHSSWLLVLDNANDLALVDAFLPFEMKGHLLLTTHTQSVGTIANLLEVPKMTRDEGVLLLLRRSGKLSKNALLNQAKVQDQREAEVIVKELDELPLAIDQAGAYIEETGCSLSSYLERYRSYRQEMLQYRGSLPPNHPEPVATTWSLSFHAIEQTDPIAVDILYLCAFLDADAIPEEIFMGDNINLGPHLKQIHTNPTLLDKAISILRKYSLIHRNSDEQNVTIHRLVQAVLKDAMPKEIQHIWAERALNAVNAVFPVVNVNTWEQCHRYLSQAKACMMLIQDYTFALKTTEELMMKIAMYDKDHALYSEAEVILKYLTELCEQTLEPEHPKVAESLNNLAYLYYMQGKYEQAEPLFQRSLTIRMKVLRPEDPNIAMALNNLAYLYYSQKKYEQAKPLFQRALSIWEKTLGLEHPSTAISLNNLAILYRSQGKYEQAEPLFQRALSIWEKTLGLEHPNIAMSLNNLAYLYYNQRKYEQAEPLFQRALSIWEKTLGLEHPNIAIVLNNLALLYNDQGKYEQAEQLFQQALSIREKILGPEHPDTVQSLNNLAHLYSDQGKYEQAVVFLQQALAIDEKMLGLEHSDIRTNINNLAYLYYMQGKYEQAVVFLQQALAIDESVLGPEHPNTLSSVNNLAGLYADQGKYDEAQELFQRALVAQERLLGPEHPDTLMSVNNLANLYTKQGKYDEAQEVFQRALAAYERLLGPEHPNTLLVRQNYASLQQKLQSDEK